MAEENGAQEPINHKKLGVEYFNKTWELLDNKSRSEGEKQRMIHIAHASLWHWMNAPECTPTNLSIGYWQVSRVYAEAAEPENAVKYGNICLHVSKDDTVGPFYKAYAHEAIARGFLLMGKRDMALLHLQEANKYMPQIDEKDGVYLVKDLEQMINVLSKNL